MNTLPPLSREKNALKRTQMDKKNDRKLGFRSVRSFAIVIRRLYFEAKNRRKYAKNVVVNSRAVTIYRYIDTDLADTVSIRLGAI